MILRKPYAILIKHFKLIHVIFTLLSLFLFLKCTDLLSFINEYIANTGFIIDSYQLANLLPKYINILIIFGIILNIIIAILLKAKDKKITFYIINILIYVCLFIGFTYTSSLLNQMQNKIIDIRLVRALRDIFTALNVAQFISLIMYGFRAVGFDVKKFNFSKDMVDLEIKEEDSEEVEVSVDIDVNKINRSRRKTFRMLKYFYFENKLLCNIVISIISIVLIVVILIASKSNDIVYNQNQFFNTINYNLQVMDVYVTNEDKNGKVIEKDKTFVIAKIKIKKRNSQTEKLNIGRIELKTQNNTYHHKSSYKDYCDDFGTIYTNQELTSDYKTYYLIYKIPENELANMYINYVDSNENIYKVNFNYMNMTGNKRETITLNETKKFDKTILNNYELVINSFNLNKIIEINYKYCLAKDNCLSAKEYIAPTISTNYDKAVLRLDGTLTVPEEYNNYVGNMEMLLNRFGYLEYVIDGKTYTSRFLGTLKANKVKQENTVYLEVKDEVLKASKISLIIKLRNQSYELILKDGES